MAETTSDAQASKGTDPRSEPATTPAAQAPPLSVFVDMSTLQKVNSGSLLDTIDATPTASLSASLASYAFQQSERRQSYGSKRDSFALADARDAQAEWGGHGFGLRNEKSIRNLREEELRGVQEKEKWNSTRANKSRLRNEKSILSVTCTPTTARAAAVAGIGGNLCENGDYRSRQIFSDLGSPNTGQSDLTALHREESPVYRFVKSSTRSLAVPIATTPVLHGAVFCGEAKRKELMHSSSELSHVSVEDEEALECQQEIEMTLDALTDQLLRECDEDGSGYIDAEELRVVLPKLGVQYNLTEEQCDRIIQQVDMDGNGLLDHDELRLVVQAFCTLAEHGVADRNENEFVHRVFDLIDKIQTRGRASNNIANRIGGIMGTKSTFTPDSRFKRWWEIVSLLLMFYYWVSCSITLAFSSTSLDWSLLLVDLVATAVHVADMIIHMNTAVVDSTKIRPVVDKKIIFAIYARFYLWIDLISVLPIDIILWYASTAFAWRLARFRKIIYTVKWRHLFKVHDKGLMPPDHVQYYFYVVPVLKTVARMIFLAHVVILIRASIATNDHYKGQNCSDLWYDVCKKDDWSETYYYSTWWVWWQITSQGNVMISLEAHILALFVMCVCVAVQSQVMAEMSALLVQGNMKQRNDEAMRELRARMLHFGIPRALQQEVLSFNYHTLGGSSAVILKQHLNLVPEAIIQEVFLYIKITVVEGVRMFANVSTECTMALANCLLPQYADPHEIIIRYGSLGTEMYFLMYGHADVLIPIDGANWLSVAVLKQGDLFGEVALLKPHIRRTANVQALGFCDLFVLLHNDFDPVKRRYDELAQEMAAEATKRGLMKDDASTDEVDADATPESPEAPANDAQPPARPTFVIEEERSPRRDRSHMKLRSRSKVGLAVEVPGKSPDPTPPTSEGPSKTTKSAEGPTTAASQSTAKNSLLDEIRALEADETPKAIPKTTTDTSTPPARRGQSHNLVDEHILAVKSADSYLSPTLLGVQNDGDIDDTRSDASGQTQPCTARPAARDRSQAHRSSSRLSPAIPAKRNPTHHPMYKGESPRTFGTRTPHSRRMSVDARYASNVRVREPTGPLFRLDPSLWACIEQVAASCPMSESELHGVEQSLGTAIERITSSTQAAVQPDIRALGERTEAMAKNVVWRLQQAKCAVFESSGDARE